MAAANEVEHSIWSFAKRAALPRWETGVTGQSYRSRGTEVMMKGWLRAVAATAVAGASSAVFAFDYFQPLPKEVPVPASNPLTEQKAELGKQLFFDTRLSVNGSISCNS